MTAPTLAKDPTVAQSYRGTKLHAMRVPDEVWAGARARADDDGSSVNAEVVAFLRAYAAGERYVLKARKAAEL